MRRAVTSLPRWTVRSPNLKYFWPHWISVKQTGTNRSGPNGAGQGGECLERSPLCPTQILPLCYSHIHNPVYWPWHSTKLWPSSEAAMWESLPHSQISTQLDLSRTLRWNMQHAWSLQSVTTSCMLHTKLERTFSFRKTGWLFVICGNKYTFL